MLDEFLKVLFDYSTSIIPAFFFGLFISSILSETLPDTFFEKVIGHKGIIFVLISSIVGALIPLCTCGMIPLASKLQKKGTPWLVTISFLTSGSASSITSLIMTLVLGLKITFLRFLFAVTLGFLVAYIFTLFFKPQELPNNSAKAQVTLKTRPGKLLVSVMKEFFNLVFGFAPWVFAAIFIACFISLYLSPEGVTKLAGLENFTSPFLLSASGLPFYFCAGSDIPISKALLEKGASLGSVLAFMNSSSIVNIISLFLLQKWLGFKSTMVYITVSFLVCGIMGLVINMIMLLLR